MISVLINSATLFISYFLYTYLHWEVAYVVAVQSVMSYLIGMFTFPNL